MAFSILKRMQENTDELKEIYLSPYDVVPSEDNFYSQESIEELADTFLLCGQQQPTLLRKVGGEYRICSGHRRNLANIYNIERGEKPKDHKVKYFYKEMSEDMFQIQLLIGNMCNRKLSSYEEMEGVRRLEIFLKQAAENGEIEVKGKLRTLLAETAGKKETTVAEYQKIDKSLSEEGKQAFKEGEINKTSAYGLSQLEETQQKEIIDKTRDTEREVRNKAISDLIKQEKEKQKKAVKEYQTAGQQIEQLQGQDNILNHQEWCPESMSESDTKNLQTLSNTEGEPDSKEQHSLQLNEVVEDREHVFEKLRNGEITVYLFKDKKIDGTYLKKGDEYYIFPEDRSEFIKTQITCLLENNDGLKAGYMAAGIKRTK